MNKRIKNKILMNHLKGQNLKLNHSLVQLLTAFHGTMFYVEWKGYNYIINYESGKIEKIEFEQELPAE